MNQTTKILFTILSVFVFFSCTSSSEDKVNVNISVDENAPSAAEGFNLEQFHRLLIEEGENENTWDAQFLSDLVNREDINNLDLNLNGTVDTILVEPFDGGNSKGFTLYTKVVNNPGVENDEEQTIATVVVEKVGENGNLTVSGNEQVYGRNHHYRSSNVGTFFLMYWMFSPRMSYGRGYYSGYNSNYAPRQRVTASQYKSRMTARNNAFTGTKAAAPTRPSTVSQNAAKQRTAAKGIKSKLNNPTSSQRAFRAQNTAKKASGFNRNSTGTRAKSSSGRTRSGGGK